jgi:hypothetical protein
MDIDSAKLVLKNQTFRYSSPLKFNDPFDIQNELKPDYDLSELPRVLMEVIEAFVLNNEPLPTSKLEHPFAQAILILRDKAKMYGYKKSEIEKITYPLLGHLLHVTEFFISQINDHWQKSMRDSRVFCVTEDNDNLLMWAHYAKDHTGVVFQVAVLPDLDTPLSVAKKIEYEDKPVQFYTLRELVLWNLFDTEPDVTQVQFSKHAYRKSQLWSYEKEWRVLDMCHYPNKKDEFIDHKFIPKQLQKIFIGCKFDDKHLQEITQLAQAINPNVEILRANKHPHKYELEFKKI